MPAKGSTSPAPNGKKRSSSIFSSGDDSKKARGRPRVEPQDETAADRRRTQIRLAQRTYRQRKESTITTLQTKVSQLETIIHEMHASFQSVKQDALTSNLGEANPSFARKFADATKKFDQLARDAKVEKRSSRARSDDWGSDDVEEVKVSKRIRTNRPSSKTDAQKSKNVPKTPVPTIVSQGERGIPSVWGYETIYDEPLVMEEPDETNIPNDNEVFAQTTAQTVQPLYNETAPAPLTGYFDQTPGPLTPYGGLEFQGLLTPQFELPLPTSIAYQETSFGRRLHRTVLEAAVRLLNEPFPDAKKLHQKFSHVMRYASQEEIAKRLYLRLLRSKTEPLESNFDYPSISYFGPYANQEWKIPPEHQAQIDFLAAEDNEGDGAWYTPSDVQTYIEAKGLYIDPSASVVEWDTDIITPHVPRSYSPAPSSHSDPAFYGTPTSLDSTTLDFNSKNQSSMAGEILTNMTPFNGDSMSQIPNYIPSPSITPTDVSESHLERTHKRVTINVNKLIGELIKAAVCLGRSPGFRRRDVEHAFRKSITAIAAC